MTTSTISPSQNFNTNDIIKESKYATKSKEVPTKIHRQKRIQKKYIKRYGYKTIQIPNDEVYVFEWIYRRTPKNNS